MSSDDTITRRNVIKTAGAAFALGVGVAGSATASPECVVTSTDAGVSDICGGYATAIVEEGQPGFVQDTCFDGGYEYKKVNFACSHTWWVKAVYLESTTNCFC